MSARQFVREVLLAREDSQGVGSQSGFGLQAEAEERLESEIDAVQTRVVKGDGTESGACKEDIEIRVHSPSDSERSQQEDEQEGE